MKPFPVLGFDIGGTKIAVCLCMSDGKILASTRVPTTTPEVTLPAMVEAGRALLKEAGMTPKSLRAIGIGSPAPHDIPTGRILAPTNMKSWVDVPVREHIRKAFGVETYFDNDANGGALAEWIFGAAKGCSDFIYFTLSTGIGGGIVTGGRLLRGTTFLAGEVGHVILDRDGPPCACGLNGCYEAYCGGVAVAKRLKKELKGKKNSRIVKEAGGKLENVDMVALLKAVRAKDPYALKVWDEMAWRHAQAIGMLCNIFNPQKVVLGTIAVAAGGLFLTPVRKYLPKYVWPQINAAVTLELAGLGRHVGEYSGVSVALNYLHEAGKWPLPWQR